MAAPDSVVKAGLALLRARRTAEELEKDVEAAIVAIRAAADELVPLHGLKHMQAGSAYAKLRQVQAAPGLVMDAHNDVRLAIGGKGIDEPTDAQLVANAGTASIR